jgi:uncharacterized protein DUF2393
MDGLLEPSSSHEQQDSHWKPILIGIISVLVVVGIYTFLSRTRAKPAAQPDPYAPKLKLSDIKMSEAQNFIGSTVTYIDGTVTNAGDQIVTGATVHVVFKNSLGEIVQAEDVPLQVVQPNGLYSDASNLTAAPLAPGKAKTFRLTFEHISADWDRAYPQLEVSRVQRK